MTYPSKPAEERRRTFGLSLDAELAERIDVLQPKRGGRSQFIAELIELGAERRFGPEWESLADAKRSEPVAA